jgi:hypothetical protein
VDYLFLPILTVLTSVAAYAIAVRLWKWPGGGLGPAVRRLLEVIGLAAVFFAVNLTIGVLVVLLVRDAFGGFISAYVLNDQALVVLSALQGMLWSFWRAGGESRV